MAISREQKIAKAREMRAEGKMAAEIGLAVGAPESTVRNWYRGGDCVDCGAPVDGSNGGRGSLRCRTCASEAARLWPAERIVSAIQAWAEEYGEPPTALHWQPHMCKSSRRADLLAQFESGDWPYVTTVRERFGTWNDALRAAGFEPRQPGRRGHEQVTPRRRVAA